MRGANEMERDSPAETDAAADPLAPLFDTLVAAIGLSPGELARRIRAALPSAVAEVAESNRRLREAAHRQGALVTAAAAELRAAAALFDAHPARAPRPDEAARLRRLADDLERSLRPLDHADAPAAAARAGGRPRVLVADDEPDAREALAQTLEPEYEVTRAADGEKVVALARAQHPDVVLMDVFMPRLDGLQALERLRADPATADIPVIFVSAGGDDTVKARSFELGAVDYLQKPFSDRELRARVERTLRLSASHTALRALAQTDPLTGLANLRAFRARLDEEVKRARRYGTPLTCVMADMDHLKPVNDQHGHAAGDRAIAAVAAVIRGELRETDFGARYGGDEFVLLLPHTTAEDGRVLAERVCARLREARLEASGHPVPLGASFGVACLDERTPDASTDALVRAADSALYRAKRAGRSRVAVAESLVEDAPREHA
jgi:two-component system cell cycle response regulator